MVSQRKKLTLYYRDLNPGICTYAKHSMGPLTHRGEQWPHRFKLTLKKWSRTSKQQAKADVFPPFPPSSVNVCSQINQKCWNVKTSLDELQGQRERVSCTLKLSWGRACPWHWGILPIYQWSSSATTGGPRQLQMWERIMEEKNNWPGHWVIFFMKFQTECPQSKKAHLQLLSIIIIP